MTFREIIIAAIKETGGVEKLYGVYNVRWDWRWHDVELAAYFNITQNTCSFYVVDKFLFEIHEIEILDPSWSPATLAKQIDDGIVSWRNDL